MLLRERFFDRIQWENVSWRAWISQKQSNSGTELDARPLLLLWFSLPSKQNSELLRSTGDAEKIISIEIAEEKIQKHVQSN